MPQSLSNILIHIIFSTKDHLLQWATHSRLEPMRKAARTIKTHWDGIVEWKSSQINNGIMEGLNSVVQAAKRKARGYKSKHFKTIAYLITGGLDLNKVNRTYLPT